MKLTIIAAPFDLGVVRFVLAYLSGRDSDSMCLPLMLMGIGLVLALAGIAADSQELIG
jgi:hypothetical protein